MPLFPYAFSTLFMNQLLFPLIQIALSVLLVAAVLLQQRGSGLGSAFGGDSNIFRTKRGVEKMLSYATVGIAILFFVNAVLMMLFG
jgi:protein translocase SecG subunit